MKKILIALALALSLPAHAVLKPVGTLGSVDTMVGLPMGGRTITDITNTICVGMWFNGGATQYGTLRKTNTTSGYQVTSGKTFQMDTVTIIPNSASAPGPAGVGYGDNDLGTSTTSAPTNAVWEYGGASGADLSGIYRIGANVPYTFPSKFTVPTGKYIQGTMLSTGQLGIIVCGHEF